MTDTTIQNKQQQANRTQLIARLRKGNTPADGVIAKRNGDQPVPLSYSQERLWIMLQLEPDNPIYNVAGAVQFDGLLNTKALQHSLDEVVRRHEILRSRFVAECQQQVLPGSELALSCLDLAEFTQERAMELFQHCADDFIRRPFRLAEQPPLRALLVVLGERRHILLLTLHHIVSDRWSVGVLMQEVSALYGAYSQGKPSALPELPIQYGDYCVWQRGQQEKWVKHLDYWRQKLTGAPPLLELPTDWPRPPVPSYRGDMYNFEFCVELSRELKELGKQYNATLFMVIAAAFNTLLYRYTGSKDICIGYPVAGRSQSQMAALIGFFVNTLVLRCQLEPDLLFSELLLQLREQALQDQNHQELSFGQLLEALNPVRNTSHTPLFQVMLAVQNVPMPDFRMQDVSAVPLTMNNRIAQFDLSLFIEERDGKLLGSFEYSTDLFDAEIIGRMAGHLQMLLTSVADNPSTPLKRLEMLLANERQQLLDEFNSTAIDYVGEKLIHRLFEQQAEKTPEACALVFDGQTISYEQLNRRANRLAHYLLALGVHCEDRIAICLERGFEMVVGLLGILKAGAAYVPLDPDYPDERLEYMFGDCSAAALIIQSSLLGRLPPADAGMIPVMVLDNEDNIAAIGRQPDYNPEPLALGLTSDHLAYVIYTSGSTGRPKGAMNQHGGVVNRLLWAQSEYRLTASDRVMQKTPFSFDVSVWEFFLPLLAGAGLVLAKPKGHQEPQYLMDLIEQTGITTLHFVPSMLQVFLEHINTEKCRPLRRILCSGEALPYALQVRAQSCLPAVALHNLYGPTEAAVDVTAWHCRNDANPGIVPIGHAIANTAIYILDPWLEPVPLGVTGEIYIGGIAVGRGYFNRPELTAERFMPDPFRKAARMYKTGDLGRRLADGAIDYLGRNDFQVKIRGFRIELGEIENRLSDCIGVREAVVIAREDGLGGKRLVAYLTKDNGSELSIADLRADLSVTLPDYMLPSAFVILSALPLTANGKLDRGALPVPDADAVISHRYEAPQGSIEIALARIWQELLELERVGRNDHFFELGGHSLMALSLVESLRQEGWALEARAVFASPTLSSLAATIADNQSNSPALEMPPNLIPDYFGQSLSNPVIEEFRL
ncbi:amino acid adenylation domain-containing protein [Methylobacter sp. G7]|uniref:non-ribosomal peptide synthetase n=1 Tax=Methylobacter sp. G7 TaxID=3230117 RepID=UPI003D807EDE